MRMNRLLATLVFSMFFGSRVTISGLSISRFAEFFNQRVGQAAKSYLRHWHIILACQDIERGDRIQTISRRYGYGSSEALGRAFRRQFGNNPVSHRKRF